MLAGKHSSPGQIVKRFHWIADVMNHSGSLLLYWSSPACVRKASLPLAVIFCLLPCQFFQASRVSGWYIQYHPFVFLCRTSITCQLSFHMQISFFFFFKSMHSLGQYLTSASVPSQSWGSSLSAVKKVWGSSRLAKGSSICFCLSCPTRRVSLKLTSDEWVALWKQFLLFFYRCSWSCLTF